MKKNDNFYDHAGDNFMAASESFEDFRDQDLNPRNIEANDDIGDGGFEAIFGIGPINEQGVVLPAKGPENFTGAPFLQKSSERSKGQGVFANDLRYRNLANPSAANFDGNGLYFAIDGAITKFTELQNRRSTYREVAWNCGGLNEAVRGERKSFFDKKSLNLHPRWNGGFALGPASATDGKITAYTSTYGDSEGVYRNYRLPNGSAEIIEKTNFREAADKESTRFTGGAAVDSHGNYWRQSRALGRNVSFYKQDQGAGGFVRYSNIRSTIAGDTVWENARVTASFNFDGQDNLYLLALSGSDDHELWLYKLTVENQRQSFTAVYRQRVTGVLANKDILFTASNYSRASGLAWWNEAWWVIRQDTGSPNTNRNPDAALYRLDPNTGSSEEWFKGVTLHPGKESCWDRSWIGGLTSVERAPKNSGAKLSLDIKADKAIAKRGETVRYTVTAKNVGWEPYEGEIDTDLNDVINNAFPSGTVNVIGGGRGDWITQGQGVRWTGAIAPDGGTVTKQFSVVIRDMAADQATLTARVDTDGKVSNCPKGSVDRDGACETLVKVDAPAFLQISREPINATLERSQTQTNTITVRNTGGASWAGSIDDDFAGVGNVIIGTPSADRGGVFRYTLYIRWVGTLAPNEEVHIRYSVTVSENALDQGMFTAEFYSGINSTASNCSADRAPCTSKITVKAPAMLDVEKTYSGGASDNGILKYQIVAENVGGARYTGNIVDDLSNVLSRASYRAETASAQVKGSQRGTLEKLGDRLIWNNDGGSGINPGEILTISYEVSVTPETVFPQRPAFR